MSVLICRVSIDGREMAASWNRNMSCFINIAKLPSKGCHHLQFYEWHININVPISLHPHQWQILFLFQKCVANLIGKKWYYMGGFILEEIGEWRPLYNCKYGSQPLNRFIIHMEYTYIYICVYIVFWTPILLSTLKCGYYYHFTDGKTLYKEGLSKLSKAAQQVRAESRASNTLTLCYAASLMSLSSPSYIITSLFLLI